MINIENQDSGYFIWCLSSYLHPVNKNPAKIRNTEKEIAKQLNFKCVKCLIDKRVYAKI